MWTLYRKMKEMMIGAVGMVYLRKLVVTTLEGSM